jgi:2-iminobutanoate/2-iminopropanoate deaminase
MSTPIGPYSPIVSAGPWLITSGQLGLVPAPGGDGPPRLVEGGAPGQLGQALSNAGQLLAEHGAGPADVVKTIVFVTDLSDYAAVNEAYAAFFGDHRPARSVVGVAALPLGAEVEVEVWAYRAP